MRITLSTLLCTLSFLILSGVDGRDSIQHQISHRVPSSILDTCAYIDSTLSEFLGYIPGTINGDGEDIPVQACLCTSEVKTFIEFSNLTIGDMGADELELAAEEYIVEHPGAQHCIYPPNSSPRCSRDDPCGYECTNGFKHQSYRIWGGTKNECTCPSPNIVCDGRCGLFANGCPSPGAAPEEAYRPYRDPEIRARPSVSARPSASPSPSAAFKSYSATPTGSFYNAQAQQAQEAGCAPHETLCGAYAPRGRITTECVDTQNDLESCGGCMVAPPSPFLSYDYEYVKRHQQMGVDCSSLEGVTDVSCYYGRCVVQVCEVGWMVAPSGDHCVPNTYSNAAYAPNPEDGKADGKWYAPAHMPFLQSPSPTSTSSAPTASYDPATPSTTSPSHSPSPDSDSEASASGNPFSSAASSSDENQGSDSGSAPPNPDHEPKSNAGSAPAAEPASDADADGNAANSSGAIGFDGANTDSNSDDDADAGSTSGGVGLGFGRFPSGSTDDSSCGNLRRDVDAGVCISESAEQHVNASGATISQFVDDAEDPDALADDLSSIATASLMMEATVSVTADDASGAAPTLTLTSDIVPSALVTSVEDDTGVGTSSGGAWLGFGKFLSDSTDESICGNLRRDVDTGICISESAEEDVDTSDATVSQFVNDAANPDALTGGLSGLATASLTMEATASVSADDTTDALPTLTLTSDVVPSALITSVADDTGVDTSSGGARLGFGKFLSDSTDESICGNLRRDVDTGICISESAEEDVNASDATVSQLANDAVDSNAFANDLSSLASASYTTEATASVSADDTTDALPTLTLTSDVVPSPLVTTEVGDAGLDATSGEAQLGSGSFPSYGTDESSCGNRRRDVDTGVCISESAEGDANADGDTVSQAVSDMEDPESLTNSSAEDLLTVATASVTMDETASVSADDISMDALPTPTVNDGILPTSLVTAAVAEATDAGVAEVPEVESTATGADPPSQTPDDVAGGLEVDLSGI
ncbi:hypothetical protein ACEPAF_5839 [Sanghuangporus sanghuang]